MPKAADATLAATLPSHPDTCAPRDLNENDKKGGKPVALVNQTFARQPLPGEDPIGKRYRGDAVSGPWTEIVGVVEDGKYRSLGEAPLPAVFEPLLQDYNSSTRIFARSQLPEVQVVAMLRRAVTELDATVPIFDAGSLTEQLVLVLFPVKIAATVLGALRLLAIVLASTGVYGGIMAYAVARRTREIGIRVALGANAPQVLRVILTHTIILIAAGTLAGVAMAAGRLFSQILYGVNATDPLTYGFAIGLMAWSRLLRAIFPRGARWEWTRSRRCAPNNITGPRFRQVTCPQ